MAEDQEVTYGQIADYLGHGPNRHRTGAGPLSEILAAQAASRAWAS
ncbi:MAG: hypothetical protein ABSB86_14485 [Bryobacteraceae bacterium]